MISIFYIISSSILMGSLSLSFPNNSWWMPWHRNGVIKGKLTQVTEPLEHCEGPHWDADNNVLYYTDVTARLVVKYNPATGKRTQVYVDGADISPVLTVGNVPQKFIVGRGRDLITFHWDGENGTDASGITLLDTVDAAWPANQFNDGKADSRGRMWIGSKEQEEDGKTKNAALYLFTRDSNFTGVKKIPAAISNGLAWTDDDKLMYFIDSPTKNVDVFDFNPDTAEISNRRTIFNTAKNRLSGIPDGMALDADGNLWVALMRGGVVAHVEAKTGKLLDTVELPAKQVTSCVWGGANLDTLYITTSRLDLSKKDLAKTPRAGAVFALTGTGIRGQRTNKVVL